METKTTTKVLETKTIVKKMNHGKKRGSAFVIKKEDKYKCCSCGVKFCNGDQVVKEIGGDHGVYCVECAIKEEITADIKCCGCGDFKRQSRRNDDLELLCFEKEAYCYTCQIEYKLMSCDFCNEVKMGQSYNEIDDSEVYCDDCFEKHQKGILHDDDDDDDEE